MSDFGKCTACGNVITSPSLGGPGICSRCDCSPTSARNRDQEEIGRLKAKIETYCRYHISGSSEGRDTWEKGTPEWARLDATVKAMQGVLDVMASTSQSAFPAALSEANPEEKEK